MASSMRENTDISNSKDCFIWKIVNFNIFKIFDYFSMKGLTFRTKSTYKTASKPWEITFDINLHSDNYGFVAVVWTIHDSTYSGNLVHSTGIIKLDASVIPLNLAYNRPIRGALKWYYCKEKNELDDKALYFPDGSLNLKLELLFSERDYITAPKFVESTISEDKIYFNYFVKSLLSLTPLYMTFECPVRSKFTMFVFKRHDDIRLELKNFLIPSTFSMTIKTTLFDINGCELLSNWHKLLPTEDQFLYELQPSIPVKYVAERKSKDKREITFNLLCELHVVKFTDECVIRVNSTPKLLPVCNHSKIYSELNNIQKDFLRLFTEARIYDIKLKAGDTTFPVHRIILSVRSPIFREMLENRDLKFIDIPEVDALILEKFLKFLYFGIVEPLDYETAFKLLFLSNRYQVKSLKDKCFFFLKKILSEKHISPVTQ